MKVEGSRVIILVIDLIVNALFDIIIRSWRPLFMEMRISSAITQNWRRHLFGFTSIPVSQNSTQWSAGAHSKMQLLLARTWWKISSPLRSAIGSDHCHAKRTAHVASLQWVWSLGHRTLKWDSSHEWWLVVICYILLYVSKWLGLLLEGPSYIDFTKCKSCK